MTPSIQELQERAQQARADANEAFVRATSADTDVAETLAATRLAALEALAQVRINNDDRAAELAAEGLEEGAVVWRAQESGAIENVLETDSARGSSACLLRRRVPQVFDLIIGWWTRGTLPTCRSRSIDLRCAVPRCS